MLFVLIHILPGLLLKHKENVESLRPVILTKANLYYYCTILLILIQLKLLLCLLGIWYSIVLINNCSPVCDKARTNFKHWDLRLQDHKITTWLKKIMSWMRMRQITKMTNNSTTNVVWLLLQNVLQLLRKLVGALHSQPFHTDCLWKLFSPQVVGIYSSCITNKCKTALAVKPTGCSHWIPLQFSVT